MAKTKRIESAVKELNLIAEKARVSMYEVMFYLRYGEED